MRCVQPGFLPFVYQAMPCPCMSHSRMLFCVCGFGAMRSAWTPCGHLWHMLYFPFVMLCVQIVLAQNHGARCPAKALMHLHFCLHCVPSMRRLCRFCDAMRCFWTLLYRDTDWFCAEAGVLKFKMRPNGMGRHANRAGEGQGPSKGISTSEVKSKASQGQKVRHHAWRTGCQGDK